MRKRATVLIVLALLGLVSAIACSRPAPPPAPEFRTTATIKDIMDSIIDPSADGLWASVSYIATKDGVTEKSPKTDDDWKALRRHAIALMEASNMLLVPGRRVALPGEKPEDASIENTPEQIEALLKADPASWIKHAHELYDVAVQNMKAVEARNIEQLLIAGEDLDKACESCHMTYWYRPETASNFYNPPTSPQKP